eukprot:28224-Chlamydomonas_euryale.AAC.15
MAACGMPARHMRTYSLSSLFHCQPGAHLGGTCRLQLNVAAQEGGGHVQAVGQGAGHSIHDYGILHSTADFRDDCVLAGTLSVDRSGQHSKNQDTESCINLSAKNPASMSTSAL